MKKKVLSLEALLLPASLCSKMEMSTGNNSDNNRAMWKATFLTLGRSVSYSACYKTLEMSPGLSGEALSSDVKSCTPAQTLLSSLGWVAACLTSGQLRNDSWGSTELVLSKHMSDFLQLLAERKVLVLKTSNTAQRSQCRALVQIYLLTQPERHVRI